MIHLFHQYNLNWEEYNFLISTTMTGAQIREIFKLG
jgi:hypothetical protein